MTNHQCSKQWRRGARSSLCLCFTQWEWANPQLPRSLQPSGGRGPGGPGGGGRGGGVLRWVGQTCSILKLLGVWCLLFVIIQILVLYSRVILLLLAGLLCLASPRLGVHLGRYKGKMKKPGLDSSCMAVCLAVRSCTRWCMRAVCTCLLLSHLIKGCCHVIQYSEHFGCFVV